jgi:hypothetical protein
MHDPVNVLPDRCDAIQAVVAATHDEGSLKSMEAI